MGTNYYVKSEICKTCGKSDEDLHIGKSSGGWCFSLHVHPDLDINNLDDWKRYLNSNLVTIVDEYGDIVSFERLMSNITERKWGRKRGPYGYLNWPEFHRDNHSEDGPNGLLRHKIDNQHCIGHGNGTYDYMIGEFS